MFRFSKKMVALATAISLGVGVPAAPAAEAFSIGDAIGIGVAGAQIAAARKQAMAQADKEIKYYNETEEGRYALLEKFKEQYGVETDYELNQRMDNMMASLTEAVAKVDPSIREKPYIYFVNSQESFNAFCAMGHVMSVNAGAFRFVANDDELAAVVGHEMTHGQKNHTASSVRRNINHAVNAAAAGAVLGGIVGSLTSNIALVHANAHNSKKDEKEADEGAFIYITHSNYNPGACAAIWQRMLEKYGNNDQHGVDLLLGPSDHPNHGARRDKYEKSLYEYSGKHVHVKDGKVTVNGKDFAQVAPDAGMSGAERAYFVQGNLAAAYKNGHNKSEAHVQNGTVMLGAQPIIKPVKGDESADVLAQRLNSIK